MTQVHGHTHTHTHIHTHTHTHTHTSNTVWNGSINKQSSRGNPLTSEALMTATNITARLAIRAVHECTTLLLRSGTIFYHKIFNSFMAAAPNHQQKKLGLPRSSWDFHRKISAF